MGPVDNPDGATSIARTCGPSGAYDAGQIRGSRITKRENQTITIQRYSVNQHPIQTLLWIECEPIPANAPSSGTKVRDFIDEPGRLSHRVAQSIGPVEGRNQIGGQAHSDRRPVASVDCRQALRKVRITIAFHRGDQSRNHRLPLHTRHETASRRRCLLRGHERIERLRGILNNSLGLIELNADLDSRPSRVRINSQGVPLNAADFAMSKMAANEKYNGHQLRKCIDYFCHLAIAPEAYDDLARDSEFSGTKYFQAMEWLKHEKEDLYDPSYTDMLRVAFTSEFRRGRLEDLVALLSGRNFETREFEEIIAEASFRRLEAAILRFMNETDFRRFIMILRSAGFVRASMIRSQNTVNFAYILYLTLRARQENPAHIETLVRRWFVMSVLTGRYTGSPETAFGVDIRNIADRNAQDYLDAVEQAELSDAFWNAGLPQQMDTSVASSPYFNVFLASQVKANDKGFISSDHTVQTLLEGASHVHHVFPRNYLKNHGLPRSRYNQIANYVVMQGEINIAIGDNPPAAYFSALWRQCENGEPRYGGITDADDLRANFQAHCIPQGMDWPDVGDYDAFLKRRRLLMAVKIRDYYKSL